MNLPRRTVTKILESILASHERWHLPIDDKETLIECLEDAVLQCAAFSREPSHTSATQSVQKSGEPS